MTESLNAAVPDRKKPGIVLTILVLMFGIAIPTFTLFFELFTRMCTDAYLNPIPSPLYAILIAIVPAACALSLKFLRSKALAPPKAVSILTGAALAISGMYALAFLPLGFAAVVAILIGGLGLLPLSPICSFTCLVILSIKMIRIEPRKVAASVGLGFFVASIFILGLQCNALFTRQCVREAVTGKPEDQRGAIRLLRALGNRDIMLRDCYAGWSRTTIEDLPSMLLTMQSNQYVNDEDVRKIFYRVTGMPFNTFERPGWSKNSWQSRFDADVAGTQVGGMAEGLSMASSSLSGIVSTTEGLGKLDLEMQFANESISQQEARMELSLPQNAVCDGAWLWVNGEQRPAVFGERSLVRKAYENVVRRSRDPLLVSEASPGRLLVQCFPVPPATNGKPGIMRIKLALSMPLSLTPDGKHWWVTAPKIAEKNFSIAKNHSITIDVDGAKKIERSLNDNELKDKAGTFTFDVPPDATDTFAKLADGKEITAAVTAPPSNRVKSLMVVIDGGTQMAGVLPALSTELGHLPEDVTTKVFFASDEITKLTAGESSEGTDLKAALPVLGSAPCTGGPDNTDALKKAVDLAAKSPGAAVLWIHGPQPITPQFAEIFPDKQVTIYELETECAANKVVETLKAQSKLSFVRVPRKASAADDLKAFINTLNKDTPEVTMALKAPDGTQKPSRMPEVITTLYRNQEVALLIAGGEANKAAKTAAAARIITPVSSAVVLETQQDYEDAGLAPKTPGKNISFDITGGAMVPESDSLWLLLAALIIMVVMRRRRFA